MDMTRSARSAATLLVLAVIFVAGLAWAWSRVTAPFPEKSSDHSCDNTLFTAGNKIVPADVLVSVLNAGDKSGLASDTMARLVRMGFGHGEIGDAPHIHGAAAQVWSSEPDGPAARLVASYLGKSVRMVDQTSAQPGVTVVVGDDFAGVVKGAADEAVEDDTYVCSPPSH
jgi:LytR cell envelope-related transcriptional attenuator